MPNLQTRLAAATVACPNHDSLVYDHGKCKQCFGIPPRRVYWLPDTVRVACPRRFIHHDGKCRRLGLSMTQPWKTDPMNCQGRGWTASPNAWTWWRAVNVQPWMNDDIAESVWAVDPEAAFFAAVEAAARSKGAEVGA